MSANQTLDTRLKTQSRRIEDLTSLLEDLRSELTTLRQRFDRLRDDHSDQLASLRGRITASERWSSKRQQQEDVTPATVQDIFNSLTIDDRRILRAMLGTTSPPPTSGQSQTENR